MEYSPRPHKQNMEPPPQGERDEAQGSAGAAIIPSVDERSAGGRVRRKAIVIVYAAQDTGWPGADRAFGFGRDGSKCRVYFSLTRKLFLSRVISILSSRASQPSAKFRTSLPPFIFAFNWVTVCGPSLERVCQTFPAASPTLLLISILNFPPDDLYRSNLNET